MKITLGDIVGGGSTIAKKLWEAHMYPNRPAGGHVIVCTCTHRICIIRGKKESR